jgi:hypothetical protein
MNDDIILNNNIVTICYETITIASTKKVKQIVKQILQFYCKYILGSKNTYVTTFLSRKLQNLQEVVDNNIYRKLLVEIYVFLSICNKPVRSNGKQTKKVKLEEAEQVLLKELNSYRREEIILGCVNALIKTKADLLWQVVLSISKYPEYIKELNILYSYLENKQLLFEAYRTLVASTDQYIYSNSEYSNLIFQCMLKVNYIYEEHDMFDKNMDMYIACLNCPHDKLIPNVPFSVRHSEEPSILKVIDVEKQKHMLQETMLFEKI